MEHQQTIEIDDSTIPEIRKVLKNPKITFVLGGPASGKGTQCAKLVEEFGYTHISTGDLFRAEVKKGSKEGQMMQRIMNEGGLIPYQLTVQVLVNALIKEPSQNYLIDGFPRAVDQAVYFEQVVGECQNVLYFNTPIEVCVARCLERAKTSGRSDDTEQIIHKRLQTYNEQSVAVVELYDKFGKVRSVDGTGDPMQVWKLTRQAMLPQVIFMIGSQGSGKSTLSRKLGERTNAKCISYNQFVKDSGLNSNDDDSLVLALIQSLADEISPRVIIEDFPQSKYQAKLFIKNCVQPHRVFVLNCSKDSCQERMIALGEKHPSYVSSSVLNQKVRQYNERSLELLPFLIEEANVRQINTEQTETQSFKEICQQVEPTIITVRSSGSDVANDEKANIMNILADRNQVHKFIELNISDLIHTEVLRKTEAGLIVQQNVDSGKNIWADCSLIVKLLRRVIYSGVEGRDKFLLNGFPDQIEQAQDFEANCASIKAIIFTTASFQSGTVEIKGNDLSLRNLDTIFAKNFKLKVMKSWDESSFNKMLGNNVSYGVVIGRPLAGKTYVSNQISQLIGGKVISLSSIADSVKKTMGTEEEPFEGEVPSGKVFESVMNTINTDQMNNKKFTYIFDGFMYSKAEFQGFAVGELGRPEFLIHCQADKKAIDERYKKKNETEEITEEQAATLEQEGKDAEQKGKDFLETVQSYFEGFELTTLKTSLSFESVVSALRNMYSAKVVIINHEKRLQVDTASSNVAIKYNMLYLSVYQLIKQQIEGNTQFGQQLKACYNPKHLSESAVLAQGLKDETGEATHNPVHYDQNVVMKLVQHTIAERRTNQRIILLEGLCNNAKMEKEIDRLSFRYMDEIFAVEKNIGEIASVLSLQYIVEPTKFEDQQWEKFEEPVVEEKKVKVTGEGEEEAAEAAPAEAEGEAQKAKYNPADYKWTITNRHAKNLPQLFRDHKGTKFVAEEKTASGSVISKSELIADYLDSFCARLVEDDSTFLYQQVIFNI